MQEIPIGSSGDIRKHNLFDILALANEKFALDRREPKMVTKQIQILEAIKKSGTVGLQESELLTYFDGSHAAKMMQLVRRLSPLQKMGLIKRADGTIGVWVLDDAVYTRIRDLKDSLTEWRNE